jgi:hypothetical protein
LLQLLKYLTIIEIQVYCFDFYPIKVNTILYLEYAEVALEQQLVDLYKLGTYYFDDGTDEM